MFRILDRYIIREIVPPLVIGLVVLTFVLVIPPILQQGEALISKGVEWSIVARVLITLLPQALSITIPMSVLLGILVAFGRLSGDREFVAMQACGVSVFRLLRPITVVAFLGMAGTAYEIIVALPDANQTFREITFGVVASRVEGNVKPRVFFEDFPNRVLYVRDLPPSGGWRDVFLADSSQPNQTTVYFAREGRILVDRAKRTVQLELKNGTWHTTLASKPDAYDATEFESILLTLDPTTVFPPPPSKGAPEMTIAELRHVIAERAKTGSTAYAERFMIQYKFSIPIACLVLAAIGLALGVSNRRDGKLASFALGFVVIFTYYVLLFMARSVALGSGFMPSLAPWVPNIVLGAAGLALIVWRARSADQPIRISLPFFRNAPEDSGERPASRRVPGMDRRRERVVLVVRIPHLNLPRPRLLDLYISRQYVRVFVLGVVSLLGIFYISTFIDLADKLFRGAATTGMLLDYFYYATPQFVYYIIPMSGLIATLVTIGVMTKTSELVVMRACGLSLYRAAAPLVLFGLVSSAILFAMQERVLATANREADRLNSIIRGFPISSYTIADRRWMVGHDGDIYHYDFFDPQANRFTRFTLYGLDERSWGLDAVTYANAVVLTRRAAPDGQPALAWKAENGWERDIIRIRKQDVVKTAVNYLPFSERDFPLEPPSYFKTELPDATKMTYGQLDRYIVQLRDSGFNAVPQTVQLRRKLAFPFVTVIMTLLAVPFAVTTGRRGAMYGIGVGIALAIVYWLTLSVFGALGEGGVIPPLLAAWAPNILFGAAAGYMLLTVRT